MREGLKIKGFLYFIYVILLTAGLYFFVTAVQVPIDPATIPDYTDYNDGKLPNIQRYESTIAIIDRDGIEHHYMMDENGEPIFDDIDKDYTNPVYRAYLSYKYR